MGDGKGIFSRLRGMLQARQETVLLTPASAIGHLDEAEQRLRRESDASLAALAARFSGESAKTRENIVSLRKRELLNRNIEERHLQILEGNRSAYIKKVEQFLEIMESSLPFRREKAQETAALFRMSLEGFVKSTQKSYFILQEFLANESGAIAGNLKRFDSLITELKDKAESQEKLISGLRAACERLARLCRQPGHEERLRGEGESSEKAASSAGEALEKFRQGASCREYSVLKDRLLESESQCGSIEEGLSQRLGVIGRALRKYSKMSAQPDIVEAVLTASVRMLLSEPERLERLLPLLERAIRSGELDLKDRKQEKSLDAISSLAKELPALAKAFSDAQVKRQEADALLRSHPAKAEERRLRSSAEEAQARARLAGEALRSFLEISGMPSEAERKELEGEVSRLLGKTVLLKGF